MNPETIYSVVFSPTGTSDKIAAAIARAASHSTTPDEAVTPVKTIDVTHKTLQPTTLPRNAVAVVAVPVYGGHPAPTALKRLNALQGEGTPVVVVAVYGNRDIGDAASELGQFLMARGFVPVAAAAFVGEHSYSSPAHPIAAGRPDSEDFAQATAFGAAIRLKLSAEHPAPVDVGRLHVPYTPLLKRIRFGWLAFNYLRRQKNQPAPIPQGDAYRCTHCGRCAAICPVDAIERGDELHTDRTRCIRCNACVKNCPTHARSFLTPFSALLARYFATRKQPVTLL